MTAALALGAHPEPPAIVCAYCWPRLIQAEHFDDATGFPCCVECAALADKGRPGGPAFLWRPA